MTTKMQNDTDTRGCSTTDRCRTHLPATLIVNSKSRTGKEAYAEAIARLQSHGITLETTCSLDHHEKLPEVVQDHIRQGAKTIIVGGGDGSLRLAAEQLLRKDVTMGVLPLGTINDFAKNLNIEPTIEGACRVIAAGRSTPVDVGKANDNIFLITVSLGFAAESQRSLRPMFKKLLGPAGYLVACALALRRIHDLHVTIRYRNPQGTQQVERFDSVQVGLLKGHYWLGGAVEIPGIDLTTDNLAFYAVPSQKRLTVPRFLSLARELGRGAFFKIPDLHAFAVGEMTIETQTPQQMVIDGDLCGMTPVHISVLHNALKVYAGEPV